MTATDMFRRMDESTADQWALIGTATTANQARVADEVLGMLRHLGSVIDGFAVDQLQHCLQTATRAEQFADEFDQTSFDPDYPTVSLDHFEPLGRRMFVQARGR